MGKKKYEGWVIIRLNLRFYPGGDGVVRLKKFFSDRKKSHFFRKLLRDFGWEVRGVMRSLRQGSRDLDEIYKNICDMGREYKITG